VLRKWVAPSLGQALFFIRDPFVLLAYGLALRHGFFPRGNPFLLIGAVLGAFALLLVGVQALAPTAHGEGVMLIAGYGWRNYFFYIPLAFVIGEAFGRADLERIVRWTLFIAVPTSALVFLQFVSPLDSPVNVGFGAAKAMQYRGLTIDGEHTRPMGFFTSDIGQKEFVVSALAMAIALWISPVARRFVKFWVLLPTTCAVLTCLAVGGSRGAMVHAALVMLAAVACAVLVRGGGVSARALIWPAVIGVAAAALYPVIFPEGFSAFVGRWNTAYSVEQQHFSLGIVGRALYGFVDFFSLMGDAPLVGYGLGLAGNASTVLGITIDDFTGWAETDWARHIVDLGPVIGLVFIGYRIAFTGWLGLRCLSGARRLQDPLPLLLFAFVGVDLLYGLMTGHGTVNGYVWLFTGFCLAAASSPVAKPLSAAASVPFGSQPRFANLMR
jgi:hypothetical protein